jgi:hypothetical protein
MFSDLVFGFCFRNWNQNPVGPNALRDFQVPNSSRKHPIDGNSLPYKLTKGVMGNRMPYLVGGEKS